MTEETNPHVSILAGMLILAAFTALAPSAAGSDLCQLEDLGDPDDGNSENTWIRASHPASDQVMASQSMNLFLQPDDRRTIADESFPSEWTNGLDAYVYDLGCETTRDWEYCISALPGSSGDGSDPFPLLDDSGDLLLPPDTYDWRLAFYPEANPASSGPNDIPDAYDPDGDDISEVESGVNQNGCDPTQTDSGVIPEDSRYVVIWLDSTELAQDPVTDPDAAENMIPRGYQTRDHPWGTYNVHFEFDIEQITGS